MSNKFTRRLLGFISVMILTLMTSLSTHAEVSYYLAGDFSNWGTNKIEMISDGQGQWVVPSQAVTAEQEFKIVKIENGVETWYGYNNYYVNDYVIGHVETIHVYTDNGNLKFTVSGTYRFVLRDGTDSGMEYYTTTKVNASFVPCARLQFFADTR